MKLRIRADKLTETATKIRERIGERFPNSGLWRLAGNVVETTKEADARGKEIRRPNWWMRTALIPLIVVAVSGIIIAAYTQQPHDKNQSVWLEIFHFLDASKGSIAILTGAVAFLVGLEVRLKRRRIVGAIHELRGLAHVIDMHSVTKSAERIGHPSQSLDVAGRPLTTDNLEYYLRYCTELLAIVSKVGQLYVQDFSDAAALSAVDQFESLATGFSSKIWQKLMILDRIRSEVKND